jgi:hypothetical protein
LRVDAQHRHRIARAERDDAAAGRSFDKRLAVPAGNVLADLEAVPSSITAIT